VTHRIEELEPLPGTFPIATVHDVDPAGRTVGRTWKDEGGPRNHHAVFWDDGEEPRDFGDDGVWSEAFGILRTGFVAGRHDVGPAYRAALWHPDGRRDVLPPRPGDLASHAYGVDDAGVAYGVSMVSGLDETIAVRWLDGDPQPLAGANHQSWAFAVNGAGAAVGRRDGETGREAMLWEGDGFTVLPDFGGGLASANGISEGGIVCGGSLDAQGFLHPVLWSAGDHQVSILPSPDFGEQALVEDVNDRGTAVGLVCLSLDCGPTDSRALVWLDGEVFDLNDFLPQDSGWTLFTADAVNDAGVIVGTGSRMDRPSVRAYRLVPEPSSVAEGIGTGERVLRIVPNPVQSATVISWTQKARGPVDITVVDAGGRAIAAWSAPEMPAGAQAVRWDLLTAGQPLPGGVYFVRWKTRSDGIEPIGNPNDPVGPTNALLGCFQA